MLLFQDSTVGGRGFYAFAVHGCWLWGFVFLVLLGISAEHMVPFDGLQLHKGV